MSFHRDNLETNWALFSVLATIAISIGGLVELIPMFTTEAADPAAMEIEPYTPLELAGRDIYVREGCYVCHSQMIRPMRAETIRYGEWSRAAEYAYDHPFQLGSRRIGPDLQREGGKRFDDWHYEHMRDPRATSPGSVMPTYGWLYTQNVDVGDVTASVVAMQRLGVPYTDHDVATVGDQIAAQGGEIVGRLAAKGFTEEPDREIVAVIAYLQRLGVDGKTYLEKQ